MGTATQENVYDFAASDSHWDTVLNELKNYLRQHVRIRRFRHPDDARMFGFQVNAPRLVVVRLPEPMESIPAMPTITVHDVESDYPFRDWVELKLYLHVFVEDGQHYLQVEIEP